ncbi:hypothetical protein HBA54_25480 [Pelagibius litoralis]|uniref:DUF4136 domain-containing protein n=1 Tax=Pelagibius litoralis TaxID=374515 RepID=A0A967KI60_9PROT|nr:hypothetical protein [Pelagibius litoralis]NIA71956.1 hypothetical protein [Pelagibius litoralis]
MAKIAGLFIVAILLAACAGPQPSLYAPKESRDGYAEETLPKGLYRVSFQGNRVTSRQKTETYALFRAAELTLELGAEAFVVHDKFTERLTKVTRERAYGPWGYPRYGRYHRRPYGYGATSVVESETTTFVTTLTVEPYSGPQPEDGFQAHDARAVLTRLAAQIVRPSTEQTP